jgi:hypothetical protein
MGYGQKASSEQMTFLGEEHTTQRKQASVPIYKISLVREGRVACYEQQIRSSANVSTILQTYLADVDREHFGCSYSIKRIALLASIRYLSAVSQRLSCILAKFLSQRS